MFGRKKQRIKDQGWLLLQDCSEIITVYSEELSIKEELDEDPATTLRGVFVIVGLCSYYVAGLNHADAATEMVNYYTDMVGRYPEDVNPDRISVVEAGNIINKDYQNARKISDNCMSQGITDVSLIIEKHVDYLFDTINIEPSQGDKDTMKDYLEVFYNETRRKYYGV